MAQIISNKVYEALQTPTENYDTPKGTILYANQFSGIQQVAMPADLAEVLNSNFGTIGNNILVQLAAKMQAFGNGPWYVDSINSTIYIHNRKFTQEPFCTYIYQQENGEVLRATFNVVRSTKKVLQTVTNYIDPTTKEIKLMTTKTDDPQNKTTDGTWNGFGIKQDNKLQEWWTDDETPYRNENLPKHTDPHFEQEPVFTAGAMAIQGSIERRRWQTSQAYKEYKANGPRKTTEEDLNSIPTDTYTAEIQEYLNGSYTKSDQQIMTQNIKSLIASGADTAEVCKQIFGNSTMIFQNEYVTAYEEVEVDPREYAPGGKQTDDKVGLLGHDAQSAEAQAGYERLKSDPTIMVSPVEEKQLIVQQPQAGQTNQQYLRDVRYYARCKVFKKVKKPVEVPLWKAMYGLYSRGDGTKALERALTANANGGVSTTETKLQANLEVVGRPSLRSSMVLRLENVGQRYSGYWYVKKCTHRMDAGTGYITSMELIRNNGTSGVRTAGGTINTQQVVESHSKGSNPNLGKGSTASSSFNIKLTELEVRKFKSLENNPEEQKKFVMRAAAYRDQNAQTPTKGSEGVVVGEVKATVNPRTGKVESQYININKERNVKNLKTVYRSYNFDMEEVIRQVNQDFSK